MIEGWQLAQITEKAAIAAIDWIGRGNEKAADQATVDAMRLHLNALDIDGTIVIGEGERDQAPMLHIGEKVGTGQGPEVDIALDPLEGTRLCAKALPNALSIIAMANRNSILHAPDVYMTKLAVADDIPEDILHLHAPIADNIKAVARARNLANRDVTICILDRPRHEIVIENARSTDARVHLIGDGDVAAVMAAARFQETGIDLYWGIGGAPEGVLAAAALKCLGGHFQGQLVFRSSEESKRAQKAGIKDLQRIYHRDDLVADHAIFAATGITDGPLLKGATRRNNQIRTETLLLDSETRSVQRILAEIPDD